jgi:hypothetical protein
MQRTMQHVHVKRVSVWFYVIAIFQLITATITWGRAADIGPVAGVALGLVGLDVVIAALFVVFGYFAAKAQTWAFVSGLVLYAIRAVLQFFTFFSFISLAIRIYLMYRIFQGLQACIQLNQVEAQIQRLNARQTP